MGRGLVEDIVKWHRHGLVEPWLPDSFMAELSAESIGRLERHATLLANVDQVDWTRLVDGWISQMVTHYGSQFHPGNQFHHGGPAYPGHPGHHGGHGRGPGMGAVVGGAALGFAGGMIAGEMMDGMFDDDGGDGGFDE